jgi:hypothetical protein
MVEICRVFHPTTIQYTFFSAAHGTFSKIDHILGNKASQSHNKFKKIKISPCLIADQNRIKLDLKNKRNHRKYSNTWRMSNTLLNNEGVTEEIRNQKVPN